MRRKSTTTTNTTTLNCETSTSVHPLLNCFPKGVYTSNEVMNILNCSDKTLNKYRKNGYIGYTKVGDKILFSSLDIVNFLMLNHHDPFRNEPLN